MPQLRGVNFKVVAARDPPVPGLKLRPGVYYDYARPNSLFAWYEYEIELFETLIKKYECTYVSFLKDSKSWKKIKLFYVKDVPVFTLAIPKKEKKVRRYVLLN